MSAAHRLPQGHATPSVRFSVVLGVASLVLAAQFALAMRLTFGVNGLWWIWVAPTLWLALFQYFTNRAPRRRPDLDVPPRVAPVEALAPHPAMDLGLVFPTDRLDRVWSHSMNAPVPAPRDPRRFDPFDLETVERAALAIAKQRWNFTRYTALNAEQVRTAFKTLNSHQRESYLREANDCLRSIRIHETVAELELWERVQRRLAEATNPPKDAPVDDAAATIQAIERLIALAEDAPCQCDLEHDDAPPCDRCNALGRQRNTRVEWE